MISYEVYKIIHLVSIILFTGSIGAQFFTQMSTKSVKIISGISSLFILVAGMGLLARIGVSHTVGWPVWAYVKLGIWVLVAALGPILAKRLQGESRAVGYYTIIILMIIAVYSAVTKLV